MDLVTECNARQNARAFVNLVNGKGHSPRNAQFSGIHAADRHIQIEQLMLYNLINSN